MATAAAAANESQRITQAFLTGYTPQGIVAMRVIRLGAPVTVYLDDVVPFYGSY